MLQNFASNSFTVIAVLVFIAVLLLLEGLYLIWKAQNGPEATKIDKRLRALSAASDIGVQAQLLKQRLLSGVPAFQRLLLNLPRVHHLDRLILQAGLDWTVSKLLFYIVISGCLSFFVVSSFFHAGLLVSLGAAVGLGVLPLPYVQYKRNKRMSRFERQVPEALDLLVRALRSGHSFSSGLQMIGEEMAEPIANEFRIVADEVNFGVSLNQALTNLSERIPLTDLRYFVVAVLIQRDSGGNLTEVLGNLSRLIRERLKMMAKVKVLSSEGRLSAWVLGLMPFVLAGIMNIFNPKFMSPLWTDSIGISILQYMLSFMAVGVVILRKIIRIRV
ncbi:type II secretion system F family protein [Variovorax paradoxus]|nr:type II secretion system F family protein [Variovorax paradoxus]